MHLNAENDIERTMGRIKSGSNITTTLTLIFIASETIYLLAQDSQHYGSKSIKESFGDILFLWILFLLNFIAMIVLNIIL